MTARPGLLSASLEVVYFSAELVLQPPSACIAPTTFFLKLYKEVSIASPATFAALSALIISNLSFLHASIFALNSVSGTTSSIRNGARLKGSFGSLNK